jgi:hypothetical protein
MCAVLQGGDRLLAGLHRRFGESGRLVAAGQEQEDQQERRSGETLVEPHDILRV